MLPHLVPEKVKLEKSKHKIRKPNASTELFSLSPKSAAAAITATLITAHKDRNSNRTYE